MPTESTTLTREEKAWMLIVLGLVFVLGWAVSAALRTEPPRHHHLVVMMQAKQASLDSRSRKERALLRAEMNAGHSPTQSFAILGDGIAGVAAAVNLADLPVRVFGSRSFWADLHGVGEVWQTGDSLMKTFVDAGLKSPKSYDPGANSDRLLWLAVENSRLDALAQTHIRYLHSDCQFDLALVVVDPNTSHWRVKNCVGDHEDIKGPVIVATGVSDARSILTVIPPLASPATRLDLLQARKLISGDDYLAQSTPEHVNTLIVIGSGGNAFDVARHALSEGAADLVVVLGKVDDSLKTPAFDALRNQFGGKICNSEDQVTSINLQGGLVKVNNSDTLNCKTLNGASLTGRPINLVVESLGRVSGDLPNILKSVRTINPPNFAATPVLDPTTSALIAVRLDFDKGAPPLLVTGAAADLNNAFFAAGPEQNKFVAAKNSLMNELNPGRKSNTSVLQENPPVGFAAAAFMASRLAKLCFSKRLPSGVAAFDDAACR